MELKNLIRTPFLWKRNGKTRSYIPEIMDDFSIKDERLDKALSELRIINKFLGGNSVTKHGFRLLEKKIEKQAVIKILDIGAGASDNLSVLKEQNKQIYSLDINLRACAYTKLNYPELNVICGDAERLPFKNNVFDIIHVSLFLHHFKEDEIEYLLNDFLKICRYGIIINDLRRSFWAYMGITMLTAIFSRSEMVKHDAPLSVKRGFIKSDLFEVLSRLNINYSIKRKWAFRWLVVIFKNEK